MFVENENLNILCGIFQVEVVCCHLGRSENFFVTFCLKLVFGVEF